MIDPGMMAMPVAVETTAEVAVVAEVAGEPVGNEHLAVVAEPMTADGLPANGRALARTGEHKSDRWRATKWHLVYRGHLDHERLLQRVAVATHVPLAAWSVVHRTTEDEGDLTLFGLMFKAGIDVQGKGVFDVPGADGQTSIRPTASTMKSVSWLKSIFEEHRTLPAIGRWQKYPDDNDWGDCRPKRKRDSFEGSTLLLMGPPTSAVTTATPAPVGGAAVRLSVDLDGLEVGSSEWQRAARDSITNAARAALAEAATAREAAREASNEQARAREEVEKAQLVVEEAVRTHTAQVRAASTAAATSAAAEAKAEALQAAAQSLAAALSALEGGSPDGAAPVVAAEAVPM